MRDSRSAESAAVNERAAAPETVVIPLGRLASDRGRGLETVAVSGFRLGRVPVTNRDYSGFLAEGRVAPPPWWRDPRFAAPRQPVVGVSWDDAAAFCAWLSERTGAPWRLPTEIEWEFAACGGIVAPRTAWGDAPPPGEIPAGPLDAPWETGRGTPNGFGLCDIGTIVHEWCLDWSESDSPARGPRPTLRRRASRGGSWRHAVRWSSPDARSSLPPGYRYSDYGFRVLSELGAGAADVGRASRRAATGRRARTSSR